MSRIPDKATDREGYMRYHDGKHVIHALSEVRRRVALAHENEPEGPRKVHYREALRYQEEVLRVFKAGWQHPQPFDTPKET